MLTHAFSLVIAAVEILQNPLSNPLCALAKNTHDDAAFIAAHHLENHKHVTPGLTNISMVLSAAICSHVKGKFGCYIDIGVGKQRKQKSVMFGTVIKSMPGTLWKVH